MPLLIPLAWLLGGTTVGAGIVYATERPQTVVQAGGSVDQRQGLTTGQMILGGAAIAAVVYFIATKD